MLSIGCQKTIPPFYNQYYLITKILFFNFCNDIWGRKKNFYRNKHCILRKKTQYTDYSNAFILLCMETHIQSEQMFEKICCQMKLFGKFKKPTNEIWQMSYLTVTIAIAGSFRKLTTLEIGIISFRKTQNQSCESSFIRKKFLLRFWFLKHQEQL